MQEITVEGVPAEIAPLIGLQPDAATLRIDRLYRDDSGAALESTVNYFNPARYTYRLRLERASARRRISLAL